jgi:hypothetical protein
MNISEIFAQDLRAHEYIRARNLSPTIQRTPTTWEVEIADHLEKLEAVQNILAARKGPVWDTIKREWVPSRPVLS